MRPSVLPRRAPAVPGTSLVRAVITVGYDRRRGVWMTVIGGMLTVASVLTREPYFASDLLQMMSGTLLGSGIGMLIQDHDAVLTYDALAKTVRCRNRWGRWRLHPRREHGFERLEYSIHFATLYEVAPDGRRRRVVGPPLLADRRQWTDFVDRFVWDREQADRTAATGPDEEADGSPYRRRL